MRTKPNLVKLMTLFRGVVLPLAVLPAVSFAQTFNQWAYTNSVHPSQSFASEEAAHADILSSGGGYQHLTKKAGVGYMGMNQISQKYVAPPTAPAYTSDWVYNKAGAASPTYSSEAAVVAAIVADLEAYSCPLTHFALTPPYVTVSSYGPLPVHQEMHFEYRHKIPWYNQNQQQWTCLENSNPPSLSHFHRQRTAGCPSSYSLSGNQCFSASYAFVHRKPSLCRTTDTYPGNPRGNPCDVTTGDKSLRQTDYSGPGFEIAREFHSKAFSREVGFGEHWSHNFSGYIAGSAGSNQSPEGAVTHGGRDEPFWNYASGKYVTWSGSGLEARKVGSEWVLYYPSGAKDYYSAIPWGSAQQAHLLRKEDPAGLVTTVTRDSANRIQFITGPFGHEVELVYDGNGNVEKLIDPAGEEIVYAYEQVSGGRHRLVQVTYQDATFREYHYEDASFPYYVTGITDENGDRYSTYAYDDEGRVIESEHAGGFGGVSLSYSQSSTLVTDANGNETTYNFTTNAFRMRNFTSVVHEGSTSSFVYPAWGNDYQQRRTSVTDANGVVKAFTYDMNHRTSETQASGTSHARTLNFYYLDETTDRLTRVTSPSVRTGSYFREVETAYSGSGLPTVIEISGYTPSGTAVSRVTTLDYNSARQVIEIDGPRTDVSDVTTLTYYECTTGDECGQLESVTNALGHETTFDAYDDNGRLLEMTDPNGVVTEYEYDLRGRTTSITATPPSSSARVTTYTYDDAGQLATVEAPNGMVLTYEYDEAHNLSSITDNDGNAIEYDYDLNGNRTSEDIRDSSATLKKTVDYTFDAYNRLATTNAASSITDVVFDALGNLTAETDPGSNDTDHDYDPLNRLVQTVDALSGITEYGYDKNDNLTSVEAPNSATTTYVYDDLGNLLSQTSPDTGTTTYTYDAAGNRLSQTDARGITVDYTYDALNRLTGIDYPGSSLDTTLTYDQGTAQEGRLTTMTDGAGSTTFTYDAVGNLTEESKTIDGNTHVTAYAYDAVDLLTDITYPSGRTVSYTRNVLGQVTTVATSYGGSGSTVASSVAYEPFGPLKALTFGNSLAMSRVFDQQYRLTDQTTGALQDLGFTLDAVGNIDAITDGVNGGMSQGFAQDVLHRVTTDAGSYGTKNYTYNSVGNRLTRTHGAATQTLTYTANSNRLATHDGQTMSLDAAGNTLANPAENLSFTYGAHNRQLEAYVGGVLKATFAYNGQGQRIKKVEATGAQRTFIYHYGPGGELIGETVYSSAGAKIGERDYLWLDALPLAQSERMFSGGSVTSSTFVYLHADQLNTARLATNASGTVVWRWDSDAFGLGNANQDPDSDMNLVNIRLRFPGQYLDEETGLHYNYFRDYDAVTGRYIQSDPIGLDGGLNTYLYVSANPLSRSDPLGLQERAAPGYTFPSLSPWPVGSEINTRLHDALINAVDKIVDWCTDDEDEIDCDEWLKELENSYLLLSVLYPSPLQGQALKLAHDRSVESFCASCPEECPRAPRFGQGRVN